MPVKQFKCECGCENFTDDIFRLDERGNRIAARADWYACLKCGTVWYSKNLKMRKVEEEKKSE